MPEFFRKVRQFQIKAESPPSATVVRASTFESWHSPFSEPVRFKRDPRRHVALIVSGLFAPVLDPNTQITQNFESRWHQPWSEPKRFRRSLGAYRSPFFSTFFDNTPNPANQLQGWFKEFADPVWPKKGLRSYLQHVLAYHPRCLPPADVTVVIGAIEIDSDFSEFDIWAHDEPPTPIDLTAVNVSVTEVTQDSGNTSIKETD